MDIICHACFCSQFELVWLLVITHRHTHKPKHKHKPIHTRSACMYIILNLIRKFKSLILSIFNLSRLKLVGGRLPCHFCHPFLASLVSSACHSHIAIVYSQFTKHFTKNQITLEWHHQTHYINAPSRTLHTRAYTRMCKCIRYACFGFWMV